MRIVHLADYGGPYPGSFVPMLRAVGDAAAQRGWSFDAVFTPVAATRQWFADMTADGLPVRVAPAAGRRALTAWLEEVLAERREPTVLHTHFSTFDLPALVTARRHPEVRVIWHMHTRLPPGPVGAVRNALKFGIAGRRVDAMLCVSADMKAGAHRRLAPAGRLVVFLNAVDLERFQPAATENERALARGQLGLPLGRPLLVHFGWDWDTKGGDLFLATVDLLRRAGVDVIALSVGGGEPARAASARLGLGDRVRVVEPRDDVRIFYAAADVFVASSRAEGMPYAVLEALCTGTPAVVSAIPIHATFAEETAGCVLAERRPRAFAEAIQCVLSARAEDRFPVDMNRLAARLDLGTWAQRLLDLYADRLAAG
jgi:glycosyltransferase involved in cell wall biosynthesis